MKDKADKKDGFNNKVNKEVSAKDLNQENQQNNAQALAELEKAKKKAEDYDVLWDKYIRLCADFDNARKRWEREKNELIKFANRNLIKELLVIVDELEQALKVMKEHSSWEEIEKGLEMTYNNLLNILKKEGVRVIEAKGKKFDPHLHEIIGQKEVNEEEEHIVLEEIQKGYLLGDRELRTSKVIVGIKKQTEEVKQEKENNKDEPEETESREEN